jgi:hypothetical protein
LTRAGAATRAPGRTRALLALLSAGLGGIAPSAAADSDYAYRAQPRDTLIGLGRRLLKEPARWHALQTRNGIRDPTRVPVGTVILIPRDWLRQSTEAATVAAVVGTASGNGTALRAGDVLQPGAIIQTAAGGHVTLTLPDGSAITLNEASSVELERLQRYDGAGARDTQLKLRAGGLETRVKPQAPAGRFEIRSPVAISAVRGTEFRAAVDAATAHDRTEVIDGAVGVAGARAAVVVPAGFGTISDRGGGPRAPAPLLPPPDLSAVPERLADELLWFAFPPVAGASAYRAQIARDGDFRAIVAERLAPAAEVAFASLPDGHYWLRVRSVDADGLEGTDGVRPFDRHRLPVAPQPTAPPGDETLTGVGAEFRWAGGADAVAWRFQLARDAGFGDLLVDRDRLSAPATRVDAVPRGSYIWRVSGVSAAGEAGPWSAPQRYRQKPLPAALAAPLVDARSVRFDWRGEPGQHFLLQIARDPAFRRIVDEQTVDAPAATVPRRRTGIYYARLRTTDADGYVGPFSPARQYVVPLPWWAIAVPLLGAALLL